MVDNNVQFQDIVRLTQAFHRIRKKDWDLAVFPVESHGFYGNLFLGRRIQKDFKFIQRKSSTKIKCHS